MEIAEPMVDAIAVPTSFDVAIIEFMFSRRNVMVDLSVGNRAVPISAAARAMLSLNVDQSPDSVRDWAVIRLKNGPPLAVRLSNAV